MAYDPLSRRHFLRGMGYSLFIPLLPSLLPREARAQLAAPPTRFLAMTGVNGMYPQDFWPSFDAPAIFNGMNDVRYKALSELGGAAVSNVLGTQFNSVINKINLLRGLDGTTETPGGHSFAPYTSPALSGSFSGGFGYSVDAVIADSSLIYPSAPALRALRVSPHLRTDFNWSYSYSNGSNLSAYSSDAAVFNMLFKDLMTTPSTPMANPLDIRKKKVVDLVIEDYRKLMNSMKISANDRAKVANYFDLLSDIQGRLTTPPPEPTNSCRKPANTTAADIVTAYRNHMDMIVAAFACGLTRVAVMHIPHYDSDANAVAGSGGPPGSHHSESHEVTSYSNSGLYLKFSKWQAARVAEMLVKMDAFKEADGSSVLDNSFVIWTNEMAEGKLHSLIGMPVMTAGGAGGKIRTGNFIDYRQRPLATINADGYGYYLDLGRPYNELLVTAFHVMGMTSPASFEKKSVQGFGDYLFADRYSKYFNAGKRNPLPFLYKG